MDGRLVWETNKRPMGLEALLVNTDNSRPSKYIVMYHNQAHQMIPKSH